MLRGILPALILYPWSQATEPWVQCDHCKKWQHMACALYNGKRTVGFDIPHYCPHCILGHMTARNSERPIALPTKTARDLPRTALSDTIEARIQALLESRRALIATEQECEPREVVFPIFTVRVVSSAERHILTPPELYTRYRGVGYPSQFNYRSKALVLFQTLGGVDVALYGVYVQEFGDDCPPVRRVLRASLTGARSATAQWPRVQHCQSSPSYPLIPMPARRRSLTGARPTSRTSTPLSTWSRRCCGRKCTMRCVP